MTRPLVGRRTLPKPLPLEANDRTLMAALAESSKPLGTAQLVSKLSATMKPQEVLRRLKKLGAGGLLERGTNRAQWQMTAVGHVRHQVGK